MTEVTAAFHWEIQSAKGEALGISWKGWKNNLVRIRKDINSCCKVKFEEDKFCRVFLWVIRHRQSAHEKSGQAVFKD